MIRLSISVDGETEQEFVKSVLVEHLKPRDVAPTPILLDRARGGYCGFSPDHIRALRENLSKSV